MTLRTYDDLFDDDLLDDAFEAVANALELRRGQIVGKAS